MPIRLTPASHATRAPASLSPRPRQVSGRSVGERSVSADPGVYQTPTLSGLVTQTEWIPLNPTVFLCTRQSLLPGLMNVNYRWPVKWLTRCFGHSPVMVPLPLPKTQTSPDHAAIDPHPTPLRSLLRFQTSCSPHHRPFALAACPLEHSLPDSSLPCGSQFKCCFSTLVFLTHRCKPGIPSYSPPFPCVVPLISTISNDAVSTRVPASFLIQGREKRVSSLGGLLSDWLTAVSQHPEAHLAGAHAPGVSGTKGYVLT